MSGDQGQPALEAIGLVATGALGGEGAVPAGATRTALPPTIAGPADPAGQGGNLSGGPRGSRRKNKRQKTQGLTEGDPVFKPGCNGSHLYWRKRHNEDTELTWKECLAEWGKMTESDRMPYNNTVNDLKMQRSTEAVPAVPAPGTAAPIPPGAGTVQLSPLSPSSTTAAQPHGTPLGAHPNQLPLGGGLQFLHMPQPGAPVPNSQEFLQQAILQASLGPYLGGPLQFSLLHMPQPGGPSLVPQGILGANLADSSMNPVPSAMQTSPSPNPQVAAAMGAPGTAALPSHTLPAALPAGQASSAPRPLPTAGGAVPLATLAGAVPQRADEGSAMPQEADLQQVLLEIRGLREEMTGLREEMTGLREEMTGLHAQVAELQNMVAGVPQQGLHAHGAVDPEHEAARAA
eukprot:jgi/Botrbrau1/12066/Bobra.0295s0021.1